MTPPPPPPFTPPPKIIFDNSPYASTLAWYHTKKEDNPVVTTSCSHAPPGAEPQRWSCPGRVSSRRSPTQEDTKTPHITLYAEPAVIGSFWSCPLDGKPAEKKVRQWAQRLRFNTAYLAPTLASYSSSLISLARPKSAIFTILLSPTSTFLAARSLQITKFKTWNFEKFRLTCGCSSVTPSKPFQLLLGQTCQSAVAAWAAYPCLK